MCFEWAYLEPKVGKMAKELSHFLNLGNILQSVQTKPIKSQPLRVPTLTVFGRSFCSAVKFSQFQFGVLRLASLLLRFDFFVW